ncbi:uncharacterized protein LOC106664476 [Cimex lectularius]|uniref:Uncharacterized protein n=1 Tax=Cimex lectularius TaxID=79782 RepID=A0A8I6RKM7_CIMLE|nr:uncharacterized protein LOC106664476 [Cimex lectularius]
MSKKRNPLPLRSKHDKQDCLSASISSSSSEESFDVDELEGWLSDEELRSRSASSCCACSLCDDSDVSTCCSCRCCRVESLISVSSLFSSLDSLLSSSSSSESVDPDLSECSALSSGEDCRRKKLTQKAIRNKAK